MQLSASQLDTQLKKSLSPLYLISGDEPLLIQELRDTIFTAAKTRGFSEKEIFYVEAGFQSDTFLSASQNRNLFSEKKIMDIRNPAAKFDATFMDFFQTYFSQPGDDMIFVITTDKLTAAQQKSAWFELIKKIGCYVPVWPIKNDALPLWIIERAKKFNLTISIEMAKLLANFSEGNLLGAAQVIDKLNVLYPATTLSREQILGVLSDHARFTIFDLSDAIAKQNTKKIVRILHRLKQTDEEPTLVLWAICRKLRENSASSHTKKALQQAAQVDEMIKGGRMGDVWQALLALSLGK